MKSLTDSIPMLAIAYLMCMSGSMAANAEVSSKKIDANGDFPISTNMTQKSSVTQPVTKKLAELSPINQAKYLKLNTPNIPNQAIVIAQETRTDAEKQNLLIEPLPKVIIFSSGYSPSLNFGIPSGFGAGWGDAFIGASAATAGKARSAVDGSISTGFGLGDPRNAVGLELSFNMGSVKNFGSNGTFDAKLHRVIYAEGANQVAVAAGWNSFAQYGTEGVIPSSVYGAVSTYSLLQAGDRFNEMPISFTFGVGGGNFRQGNASTGVFAGVGLQVHPQVGLGAAWSGIGINVGVSYLPIPTIPLTIGLTGGDLTNNSVGGTVLVLNVSYGFNFLPK